MTMVPTNRFEEDIGISGWGDLPEWYWEPFVWSRQYYHMVGIMCFFEESTYDCG